MKRQQYTEGGLFSFAKQWPTPRVNNDYERVNKLMMMRGLIN